MASQFLNPFAASRLVTSADDLKAIVVTNPTGTVLIQLPQNLTDPVHTEILTTGSAALSIQGINGAYVNGTKNGSVSRSAGAGTVTKLIGIPAQQGTNNANLVTTWTVFTVV